MLPMCPDRTDLFWLPFVDAFRTFCLTASGETTSIFAGLREFGLLPSQNCAGGVASL